MKRRKERKIRGCDKERNNREIEGESYGEKEKDWEGKSERWGRGR